MVGTTQQVTSPSTSSSRCSEAGERIEIQYDLAFLKMDFDPKTWHINFDPDTWCMATHRLFSAAFQSFRLVASLIMYRNLHGSDIKFNPSASVFEFSDLISDM